MPTLQGLAPPHILPNPDTCVIEEHTIPLPPLPYPNPYRALAACAAASSARITSRPGHGRPL